MKTDRIDTFLKRLSRPVPTMPAGGSAVALLGGIAASLGCFVAHLSAAHSKDRKIQTTMRRAGDRFEALSDECLNLIDQDAEKYQALVTMIRKKRPDESDAARRARYAARKNALDPQMKLAEYAVEMLRLGRLLILHGYRPAMGDAAAALETAHACLRASLLIAGENISAIKDTTAADSYRKALETYRDEGERLYHDGIY